MADEEWGMGIRIYLKWKVMPKGAGGGFQKVLHDFCMVLATLL